MMDARPAVDAHAEELRRLRERSRHLRECVGMPPALRLELLRALEAAWLSARRRYYAAVAAVDAVAPAADRSYARAHHKGG